MSYHSQNKKDVKKLIGKRGIKWSEELLRQWQPDQLRYMIMLAKPGSARQTDTAIAKELGVSTMTLWNWRNIPGFWSQVYEFLKTDLGAELVEVWRAVLLQAKSGDINAAKLVLQEVAQIEDKNLSDHEAIIAVLASEGITINVMDREPEDIDIDEIDNQLKAIPDAEEVLSE